MYQYDFDLDEDSTKTTFSTICMLMLNGSKLKAIAKETGLLELFLKEIFNSWEFETYLNSNMGLAEIYAIPDENDREIALKEFSLKWKSRERGSFVYPKHFQKGFFYVDNRWVKKNLKGEIVKYIERPKVLDIELFLTHALILQRRVSIKQSPRISSKSVKAAETESEKITREILETIRRGNNEKIQRFWRR